MKPCGKSLLWAGGLGAQAIAKLSKRPLRLRSHLLNAFAPIANFELAVLTACHRDFYLAHLGRLDGETRRERFGGVSSDGGFFERYVQDINFANTVLLGAVADGELRASAELRSLQFSWPAPAEFSVIVEREWQNTDLAIVLFRAAVIAAQLLGVAELFISYDHEKESPARFLRLLGRELRSQAPLELSALDLFSTRPDESGRSESFIRLALDPGGLQQSRLDLLAWLVPQGTADFLGR